ncbi:MAG: hypothetical protein IJY72_06420 [Akkermansia sp.]|nr:hypothetical protein [Akkermansia sp.]
MDSEIRLYLFFDNDYPLVLPSPYDEIEPEKHCACLTVCEDMEEVNSELVVAGKVLEQVQGKGLSLSVYRWANHARADGSSVRLSRKLVQQMQARGCGLDYSYYVTHSRDSRFRDVTSFFMLTFPAGGAPVEVPGDMPWLFAGEYRGERFVLTPFTSVLADYLAYLARQGNTLPALRIDYFSEGSLVIWYMTAEDEISSLAALGCEVELRVHPAMLLPKDDELAPLFRYLMRSAVWRECLTLPPGYAEVVEN